MKKKEKVSIRVSGKLKALFKKVCDDESTTMSNKIVNFMAREVGVKSKSELIKEVRENVLARLEKEGISHTNSIVDEILDEEYDKYLEKKTFH